MVKMEGHLKPHPEGKGYRVNSFDLKWGLFTKGEVKDLMKKLDRTKSTLDTALGAVTT